MTEETKIKNNIYNIKELNKIYFHVVTDFIEFVEDDIKNVKRNKTHFADIIKYAIDVNIVKTKDLAEEFGVLNVTVSRWKHGKNAPQDFIKPYVIQWVLNQAYEMIGPEDKNPNNSNPQRPSLGLVKTSN